MSEQDPKAVIAALEARGEQMRKSLKSNVKFTADREKLRGICLKRGMSFSALSVKIGHAPGWLSQRICGSKHPTEFKMYERDAIRIADVLICRTEDFSAPSESLITPIVLDINAEYKDFLDKLPADQYNILRAFMKYMRDANTSDLVRIQEFFRQPSKPTQIPSFSKRKIESSWLYSYILAHTRNIFYEELSNHLLAPDNSSLQEAVIAITGRAKHKRATLSKEDARAYNIDRDIKKKLSTNLRNAMEEDLDKAFRNVKKRLFDNCVDMLLAYYEVSTQDAVLIVNDLMSIAQSHLD